MQGQKIPVTVITGFLGAGKTTLIRNMLQNAGGRKIALDHQRVRRSRRRRRHPDRLRHRDVHRRTTWSN